MWDLGSGKVVNVLPALPRPILALALDDRVALVAVHHTHTRARTPKHTRSTRTRTRARTRVCTRARRHMPLLINTAV